MQKNVKKNVELVAVTQRSLWIPLNMRKIKYKLDGADLGFTKFKDIGIAVYGVDTNNTPEINSQCRRL